MKFKNRFCEVCKKEYVPKTGNAVCCSKECSKVRRSALAKIQTKIYKDNNKEHITKLRKEYYENNKKSCSEAQKRCYAKARANKPWMTLLRGVRARAKKKNIKYDLTVDWAEDRWTGRCELTNLPFDLSSTGRGGNPRSPSVDKINPLKGYTKDNCRIILHCVNCLKGTSTDEQTMEVVKALYENVK